MHIDPEPMQDSDIMVVSANHPPVRDVAKMQVPGVRRPPACRSWLIVQILDICIACRALFSGRPFTRWT